MKTRRRFVVIISILMIICFALPLVACKSNKTITDEAKAGVKINLYSVTQGDGFVAQTISATVKPATAVNKSVDWSVEWEDLMHSGTVTDYVTVTPDSDGSTNATVKCYQSFTGNVIVTVKTRESGFTASCIVTFLGIPSSLNITTSTSEVSTDTYELPIGVETSFNISPSNIFGSVGDSYKNLSYEVSGVGNFYVCNGSKKIKQDDSEISWNLDTKELMTVDSVKDCFIETSFSNGLLKIKLINAVESYCFLGVSKDRVTMTYTKKYYEANSNECYFQVVVTEPETGISKTIKIKYNDNLVNGVSTEVSSLVF